LKPEEAILFFCLFKGRQKQGREEEIKGDGWQAGRETEALRMSVAGKLSRIVAIVG